MAPRPHGRQVSQVPQALRAPRVAEMTPAVRPTTAACVDAVPPTPGGILALQRSIGNAAVGRLLARQHAAAVRDSAGRPLAAPLRAEVESRMRQPAGSFGDVSSRHTLAHEPTHAIQQRRGPVAGTHDGSGLSVSDPADPFEREAEAIAARVTAGTPAAPVQRAAAEPQARDEGEVFVQRRITTPARVGFEFQQLAGEATVKKIDAHEGSDVEEGSGADDLFDRGESSTKDEDSSSDDDAEVFDTDAKHYGVKTGLWYVVQDDRNLEFVTHPFDDVEELKKTVTEIARVAGYLFAGTVSEQKKEPAENPEFEVGDSYVRVKTPDRTGQPQVNADVPLDALSGMYQHAATDEPHFEGFFGIDTRYWKADTTREQVRYNAKFAAAIEAFDPVKLRSTLHMHDNASAEQLGSVQGMLQAIAALALSQSFFRPAFSKDQPLLLKTSLGTLWDSLVEDEVIGKGVKPKGITPLLMQLSESAGVRYEGGHAGILEGIVKSVLAGQDPSSLKNPRDPVDIGSPQQQNSERTGNRKQILVELRRVPILDIGEWHNFALESFDHFIEDTAARYHQDL